MSLISYLEKYHNYCVPKNGLPSPGLVSLVPGPVLKPDINTLKKVLQTVPVPELCLTIKLDDLRHLIIALKQYEHDFYNGVLNSGKPDFLITSYYSLYLRFLEVLYSGLEVLEQSIPDRDIDTVTKAVNFIIGYFGAPILQYLTRKDIPSDISDLAGILLHALISSGKFTPSGDSSGYYLSSKLHGS